MTSNTNNNTDPSEKFPQLYEVLLYKKKDITAIQKKLGINIKRQCQRARKRKNLLIHMNCC